MQRDHWAGYQGGYVVTAPVRTTGNSLRVSVDGGAEGVKVGIMYNDDQYVIYLPFYRWRPVWLARVVMDEHAL
jgi:hypothetical protein